jgi:hypothetical protein
MNRILAISAATTVWFGFTVAANAQLPPTTSAHSGTNPKVCAIGAVNGTMVPIANTIAGVVGFSGNFPKVLSSAAADGGTPGKFVTLCNTDPSQITVNIVGGNSGVTVPPNQIGHTTRYTLFATGTVYPDDILDTPFGPTITVSTNSVSHAFSATPTDLNV